jgi:hypothetical protein
MTVRRFEDGGLGTRFEVDDAFTPGLPPAAPAGLPDNVRAACLARSDAAGQAVLSIARVEVGYETSPQELAEQLVIHNRFTAHTAEQRGWTIHSPWKATMLAGYPAMHCDYVVPASAGRVAQGRPEPAWPIAPAETGPPAPQALPLAGSDAEAGPPGHVQAWVAYVGPVTWQVMLGVDPPGDLDANRRVMDRVTRTFELFEPAGQEPVE